MWDVLINPNSPLEVSMQHAWHVVQRRFCLGCRPCTVLSALVVLLIVIREKILISSEAWSTQYQERRPKLNAVSSEEEPNDRSNGNMKKRVVEMLGKPQWYS